MTLIPLATRFLNHVCQRFVRQDVGTAKAFIIPFQQLGKAHAAQDLNGEDFLYAGLKAQESDGLTGFDIDDPYTAGALAHTLDQRNTAEHGALAHLR